MLAPPSCPALTILANQSSEPDTGAPIALLAAPAERQHAIGQLVMDDAGRLVAEEAQEQQRQEPDCSTLVQLPPRPHQGGAYNNRSRSNSSRLGVLGPVQL
jgi:hypothetical protein